MNRPHHPQVPKGGSYPKEFREEAVRYWISSGKKESEVAHELGVSGWSLSRWRRALEGDTTSASDLPGITEPNALELAREVGRLRRENEALTRQRDIRPLAKVWFTEAYAIFRGKRVS